MPRSRLTPPTDAGPLPDTPLIRHPALCFLVGLLLSIAAVLLTLLTGLHRGTPSLAFFYVALLAAGLLGGLRSTATVAVLSLAGLILFVYSPIGRVDLSSINSVRVATFLVSAVMVGFLTETMHRARRRAERGRQQAEALANELARKTEELAAREQSSRELTERLKEAQNLAGLGSWEYDLLHDNLSWSDEMCAIYGVAQSSAPRSLEEFLAYVHREDRDLIRQTVRQTSVTHKPWSFEHRIIRPDGSVRIISGRGEVLSNGSGEPIRLFGTATDVTERRQAEERERALMQERAARAEAEAARLAAEAANRAKTRTLAVTSHDLRTPLNAIGGYAQLMEMGIYGPVTEKQRDALLRIAQNQERLNSLLNQLLAYARVETGKVEYQIEDLVLDDAIKTLEVSIAPDAQRKGLCYEYSPCEPDLVVRADRERVEQVLLNLVANAIKYTGPGGRVSVDCLVRDGYVGVRVHDTGAGIPEDKLHTIFEPYVRVGREGESDNGDGGVGLGLAISRELARAMGGDVVAESRPGRGSTFTLWLPRSSN